MGGSYLEERKDVTQADVMGLVIEKLYFGKRPGAEALARNGSILKRLHAKGHSWDRLARVVEGLGLRRDRGELKPTIRKHQVVDLRWVWAKDMDLNQLALCEDAFYKDAPTKGKKDGAPQSMADLLAKFQKGAA